MEQSGQLESKKLVCKNVSKSFYNNKNKIEVIDNISFEAKENEFLVLFGPGQCGKTTLLNLLAGLDKPTSGEIFHNGKPVLKPDPSRAVVYQTLALFPWLTVKGNVEFSPKSRGINKKERDDSTAHFIDLVGLKGFEDSFPMQLSGGMKQRVGIARAYSSNPDILFMDEPFGHLDAQTRYMMQESLEEICANERRTVVFVTNNIEEATYLADRILLFSDCPSKICAEYKIDLPRPRNIVDPDFLQLRQEITNMINKITNICEE